MRIVVRLPNWLGDLVMSTAFIRALVEIYPEADIDVIVKRGIDAVVDYLPGINQKFVFSKEQYKGLRGAWQYGKSVAQAKKPDIFICLPESFSSATMAKAAKPGFSIGYSKEFRDFLLHKTMKKDASLHRVDQYLALLELLDKKPKTPPRVILHREGTPESNRIIVNVNSEADSRRLPVEKAISILNKLRSATSSEIVLVGSPKEKAHVDMVMNGLYNKQAVVNQAGQTDMHGLIRVLGSGTVMLTTDSGPMHVANALGTYTVALEGASDEKNTAPYNADKRSLVRYGKLACEPCVKNTCKYGTPKCLMSMDEDLIVAEVLAAQQIATN